MRNMAHRTHSNPNPNHNLSLGLGLGLGSELWLGSSFGQECANCACAISKLRSATFILCMQSCMQQRYLRQNRDIMQMENRRMTITGRQKDDKQNYDSSSLYLHGLRADRREMLWLSVCV